MITLTKTKTPTVKIVGILKEEKLMSYWTYINGTITVAPMGRTQAEKRYILETVLDHLPIVSGSERNMDVYIIQKNGYNCSSSHTEFGEWGGYKDWKTLSTEVQDEYILVVNAALRDREFEQTYKEFMKWLVRLCKRTGLEDILVEIKGYNKSAIIKDRNIQNKKYSYKSVFDSLYENPSWCNDNKDEYKEPNWCEYLMWNRAKNSDYPMLLAYKYFDDEENDKEVERRMDYGN